MGKLSDFIYFSGVFPRVSLDLPRLDDEGGQYAGLLKEARENLMKIVTERHKKSLLELKEMVNPPDMGELRAKVEESKDKLAQPSETGVSFTYLLVHTLPSHIIYTHVS